MTEIVVIPAKNRTDEIVRTAAYARVSSDSEDQLNSFAAQIRYYTELLKNSENTVFIDMYADEGLSGTSAAKRTDFQRLMDDCRKGKIDRILTKSVSRFARNTKDCLEAIRELKTLGVSVYFEKENIDTAEISSEIMLTMYSQFAQEESMSISKNCRMGIQKRMADGTYKNASVSYGYKYSDGKVIIDEEQAAIVRRIFSEYLSGRGIYEIAVILNSDGVAKPPEAKEWYPQLVSNIIKNERYIGDSLLQKKFMTDTFPFQKKINHGEKAQYYISDTHEPIIDKNTFDAAQKLLKSKVQSYNWASKMKQYPLSQMIKCCCGSNCRRKKFGKNISWTCVKHDRKSADQCGMKPIPERLIYEAFVRMFNKLQTHYKAILSPMLRQLERLSEKGKSNNVQLANLRKEIAEIKQKTHLLARLNSEGTLDAAYFTERSQELERKMQAAQKQLNASLDMNDERLGELRKLIKIFEKAEPISEFDEIKFGQTVKQITMLSKSEIKFDLIGGIGFTERIER